LSDLKVDGVIASTGTNTNLTLEGKGTGGVKITDYLIQTKGGDIASATSLTLGKDGNQFDVTGTTTITSIATQGIGSYVTLHFDGALTFTHHSTNLILPGAANITTAAGDIAVMYEYASADWRCVSYTKASGAAVVAGGGFTQGTEQATTSGTSWTFGSIPSGVDIIIINFFEHSINAATDWVVTIGDVDGLETSGYISSSTNIASTTITHSNSTAGYIVETRNASDIFSGTMTLTLEDASAFTWISTSLMKTQTTDHIYGGGSKSLSAELTQVSIGGVTGDGGAINIMYQ
jgi:hypothetical protein